MNIMGAIRTILFSIDQIAYSLIDDVYNLINTFASAEFFSNESIKTVMTNTYIIIGIFALFKIVLLLINALINPDKLFEKEGGLTKIVTNTFIMFTLLIFVPILFNESMKIQSMIVEGNYVNKLFGVKVAANSNPGNMFKTYAISSLVRPNGSLAQMKDDGSGYEKTDSCPDDHTHCAKAIEDYNAAIFGNKNTNKMFSTLLSHMEDYVKDDNGNKIYV